MDHGCVRGEGNGLGKNNNEGKKWGGGGDRLPSPSLSAAFLRPLLSKKSLAENKQP